MRTIIYVFQDKEYDTDKNGELAMLLNDLGDSQIIRRQFDEVNGRIMITYFNNLWQEIGTSDNIWAVLDTLIVK